MKDHYVKFTVKRVLVELSVSPSVTYPRLTFTYLSADCRYPLPSNRQYLSYGDCLEEKREDYQYVLCAVLCATTAPNYMCTGISIQQFLQVN